MLKTGLIGNGRWGKILQKTLSDLSEIIFVSNTKKSYKNSFFIDYCFIATSDSSHFKIAKYFLKKKISVFCEKPLSRNFEECKKLIKLSRKQKTTIFIDHIENFKKKNLIIKKNNFIVRTRKSNIDIKEVLWKLCYHDLYLLYDLLKKKKLKIKIIYKNKFQIMFEIKSGEKTFNFFYDNNSVKKEHHINQTNFVSKKNYLKKMISCLLYKKNVNIKENNNQALFCVKTILLIEKIIFKS